MCAYLHTKSVYVSVHVSICGCVSNVGVFLLHSNRHRLQPKWPAVMKTDHGYAAFTDFFLFSFCGCDEIFKCTDSFFFFSNKAAWK